MSILEAQQHSRISCFQSQAGASEYFLTFHSSGGSRCQEALTEIHERYLHALEANSLSLETQVFTRLYLSDITNQKTTLLHSELFTVLRSSAYSIIQQSPLYEGQISLLVYHIRPQNRTFHRQFTEFPDRPWSNALQLKGNHYSLVITGGFAGRGSLDAFEQSYEIMGSYINYLNENGMNLLSHGIRTWIYVRDIDNNYQGMVEARAQHFQQQGLSRQTRYLASTGIEAKMRDPHCLLSMDALAIRGLQPSQITRMQALDNLCPADAYGVAFERGLKVTFGDRAHLHISGTASIDASGHIKHPTDVRKQVTRTLENIRALLAPHGGKVENAAYLIVYVRNARDADDVAESLASELPPTVPTILCTGSVCRPHWLVEIEGVFIVPVQSPHAPFL
jgi:enamine deaminase RidA (YjgF/YER057c/UK114 family)